MLIALPLAVGVVAVLAWRHAEGPGGKRLIFAVAALALGIRLAAVLAVYLVARQAHDTGVWLSDEAAFFLATEALVPDPLDRALPLGLEHLGGDAFLGLTTALAMAGRVADANTFRVANAGLGASVVVMSTLVARQLFGAPAAVVTGVLLSVWPTLVLWSATMLRDTLGSFAVVALWWMLSRNSQRSWFTVLGAAFLSLVIAASLRPYLGVAMLIGVLAWAAYPAIRGLRPRTLTLLGGAFAILVVGLLVTQARRIDFAAHELIYRQTMTRIETLGRLYTDTPPLTADLPIKPGKAVGLVNPATGWTLGGVVQDFDAPDVARVAFVDGSVRDIASADLVPLESAPIAPLQLVAAIGPDVLSYLRGTSDTRDASSPAWIVVALGWDILLLLAVLSFVRVRPDARNWLYPLCIVAATFMALVAVPGAPGNADRHRATQTVPLLLVLAAGLASARALPSRVSGRAVTSMTSSPMSAPTPASSRMRSAR
jgi:hypothetical protein